MSYLYVGKITTTHGLKGELKLLTDFQYKDKFLQNNFPIYIGDDKEKQIINSVRTQQKFYLISLKNYNDINQVLSFKGKKVYITKEDLNLNTNEYLLDDLVNLKVISNKKVIGTVSQVIKDKYQNKIIVNKDGKEYFVPLVCDIIENVNLLDGSITIKEVSGLFDFKLARK